MSRVKSYSLFFLSIASALGIAWLIQRSHNEMGSLRTWQQVLIRRHG